MKMQFNAQSVKQSLKNRWFMAIMGISILIAMPVIIFASSQKEKIEIKKEITYTKSISSPQRLEIPSLQINTLVQQVGLDSQGNMETPKNADDIAWYQLGPKPGEKGSAVMAGHLDTATGAPAIFAKLSQLREGDSIWVTDTQGFRYHFKVKKTQSFKQNEAPIDTIFAMDGKPGLNLITCDGNWDTNKKMYNQRLVVFTELIP
jgi:sortase A